MAPQWQELLVIWYTMKKMAFFKEWKADETEFQVSILTCQAVLSVR